MTALSRMYWRYNLTLNPEKDADVIRYLESVENKADAIRQAIRERIVYREIRKEAHDVALEEQKKS
jgi:hypothetical protein